MGRRRGEGHAVIIPKALRRYLRKPKGASAACRDQYLMGIRHGRELRGS